ncbi:hypothetical protein B0H19DRAFT_1058324 [Mycena capillaripes]|nr:hypothetical protein B0H19DRAFT_1058324 [Mycena capillaripes]
MVASFTNSRYLMDGTEHIRPNWPEVQFNAALLPLDAFPDERAHEAPLCASPRRAGAARLSQMKQRTAWKHNSRGVIRRRRKKEAIRRSGMRRKERKIRKDKSRRRTGAAGTGVGDGSATRAATGNYKCSEIRVPTLPNSEQLATEFFRQHEIELEKLRSVTLIRTGQTRSIPSPRINNATSTDMESFIRLRQTDRDREAKFYDKAGAFPSPEKHID